MFVFASPNLNKPECAVHASDGTAGVTSMSNVIRLGALRGAVARGADVSLLYQHSDTRPPIRAFTTDRSPVLLHAI